MGLKNVLAQIFQNLFLSIPDKLPIPVCGSHFQSSVMPLVVNNSIYRGPLFLCSLMHPLLPHFTAGFLPQETTV